MSNTDTRLELAVLQPKIGATVHVGLGNGQVITGTLNAIDDDYELTIIDSTNVTWHVQLPDVVSVGI